MSRLLSAAAINPIPIVLEQMERCVPARGLADERRETLRLSAQVR
jgi:hypothetical protein